jgi:hypothetical protein
MKFGFVVGDVEQGKKQSEAAFLIANPRLETLLTHRKQTEAAVFNREFLQGCVSRFFPLVSRHLSLVAVFPIAAESRVSELDFRAVAGAEIVCDNERSELRTI